MDEPSQRRASLSAFRAALGRGRTRRWSIPDAHELTEIHGEPPPEPQLCPKQLRVLVWNVFKGRRRSWVPQFRQLAAGRDLILAQELYFEAQTRALFDESELQWATATSFTYTRRGVATGLGTAARAPSLDMRAVQTAGREPITGTPKLALLTKYHLGPGQTLLVANVHAINFAGFGSFDEQLEHIEAALADHAGPLLLAGDFNTWTPRRQRRLESLRMASSLEPVEFAGDPRTNPLDHAFVRGLEVSSAEVHRSRASDHAALTFDVGTE